MKIKLCVGLLIISCSFLTTAVIAAEAEIKSKRLVVLGDSITRGVRSGVSAESIYQTRIQTKLSTATIKVEVLNEGIGGERTDMALRRLNKSVIAKHPDIVTVMYGTNDSYVDIGKTKSRITAEAYESNLRTIVDKLRAANIQVVLMTSPRWGAVASNNGAGEHPNVQLQKYVARCRLVAKDKKVPLIDHYKIWTAAEQNGTNLTSWTTDECHPNGLGHQQISEAMIEDLAKTGFELIRKLIQAHCSSSPADY